MRYLLIDETRMIDEKSLLLAHNTTVTSEDKGLLKFLLTGVDGSSIAQVRSGDQLKAAKEGQIELLSQMAEQLRKVIVNRRAKRTPYRRPKGTPLRSSVTGMTDAAFALVAA